MTRDVSTIICVKRRGVGASWTGEGECGEAQARETEDGEDPQTVYTAGGYRYRGKREAGFEDDGGPRAVDCVRKSHVCSPGFQGTRT